MRLSSSILTVIVNPFAAPLMPDGRACALVPCDPGEPSAAKYLGVRTRSERKKRPGNPFGDRSLLVVESYKLAPIKLVDTEYYRLKLKSGELFYEDGALDKIVGAAHAAFAGSKLDPAKVLIAWCGQGLGAVVEAMFPALQKRGLGAAVETVRAAIEETSKKSKKNESGETRSEGAVS